MGKPNYESPDLVKKLPGKKVDTTKPAWTPDEKQVLLAWMRDMYAWGCEVRHDIIRLEAKAGLAPGDPGDPPPAPGSDV